MAQQGFDQLALHARLLSARAAAAGPVRTLVRRAFDTTAKQHHLGWCLIGKEPVWDGVDLSPCVRLG